MLGACCPPCDLSSEMDQLKFDWIGGTEHYPPVQSRSHLQGAATLGPLGVTRPAVQKPQTLAQAAKELADRAAAGGCRCTHIMHHTGERSTATYRMEKNLRCLVVTLGHGMTKTEVYCPVANIEDVFQIIDGEACFSPQVILSLTAEERERTFRLVFSHGTGVPLGKRYPFGVPEDAEYARMTGGVVSGASGFQLGCRPGWSGARSVWGSLWPCSGIVGSPTL